MTKTLLLQTKHYYSCHGMESILVYDTEWIGSYLIVQPNCLENSRGWRNFAGMLTPSLHYDRLAIYRTRFATWKRPISNRPDYFSEGIPVANRLVKRTEDHSWVWIFFEGPLPVFSCHDSWHVISFWLFPRQLEMEMWLQPPLMVLSQRLQ